MAVALGALLLVAAVMKVHEVVTRLVSEWEFLNRTALVFFEIQLGTWLVWGPRGIRTWYVAAMCFAVFASAAGYEAASGADTCGCFGRVRLNPWVTLGIDLAAVGALLRFRPSLWSAPNSRSRVRGRVVGVIGLLLATSATGIVCWRQSQFRKLETQGNAVASGDVVILEPEKWMGKPVPLLDYLDANLPGELSKGDWTLLLFRHECDVCHEVMLQIKESILNVRQSTRIALIGVDQGVDDAVIMELRRLGCLVGILNADNEWFVTTPTRIHLHDGVCVEVAAVGQWKSGQ